MARRKAEVVAEIMEKVATAGPGEVIPLPAGVSLADMARPVVIGMNDSPRRDTLDAIIARMAGLGGMTDRAALNVVAVSLAQLAEALRDD